LLSSCTVGAMGRSSGVVKNAAEDIHRLMRAIHERRPRPFHAKGMEMTVTPNQLADRVDSSKLGEVRYATESGSHFTALGATAKGHCGVDGAAANVIQALKLEP